MGRLETFRGTKMTKAERMHKSAKARLKRKRTKNIVAGIQKRLYRDLYHLRKKYQKIKARHHNE